MMHDIETTTYTSWAGKSPDELMAPYREYWRLLPINMLITLIFFLRERTNGITAGRIYLMPKEERGGAKIAYIGSDGYLYEQCSLLDLVERSQEIQQSTF